MFALAWSQFVRVYPIIHEKLKCRGKLGKSEVRPVSLVRDLLEVSTRAFGVGDIHSCKLTD